jgi:hypothetical protein
MARDFIEQALNLGVSRIPQSHNKSPFSPRLKGGLLIGPMAVIFAWTTLREMDAALCLSAIFSQKSFRDS